MTKLQLPNLHKTVVKTFLIINISNSNKLNKFWVGIFTSLTSHQSSWLNRSESVSQWVSEWVSEWQALPMIGLGSDKKNDWVFFSELYSARRKESFLLACKVICPNLHFCFLSPRKISFFKTLFLFFIRQANAGKADCTYCQGYSCATSHFHFATIRFSSKPKLQFWI